MHFTDFLKLLEKQNSCSEIFFFCACGNYYDDDHIHEKSGGRWGYCPRQFFGFSAKFYAENAI